VAHIIYGNLRRYGVPKGAVLCPLSFLFIVKLTMSYIILASTTRRHIPGTTVITRMDYTRKLTWRNWPQRTIFFRCRHPLVDLVQGTSYFEEARTWTFPLLDLHFVVLYLFKCFLCYLYSYIFIKHHPSDFLETGIL